MVVRSQTASGTLTTKQGELCLPPEETGLPRLNHPRPRANDSNPRRRLEIARPLSMSPSAITRYGRTPNAIDTRDR